MIRCEYLWSQGCDRDDIRPLDQLMVDSPGAQFMCQRTMTQVGPDDRLAEPAKCDDSRECFSDSGL